MGCSRISASARANSAAWSRVRKRTMTLVSTASMPAPDFGRDCLIHLFYRLRRTGIGEHSGDIFVPCRFEGRRRLQKHTVLRLLNDEPGAGGPPAPLADRLG